MMMWSRCICLVLGTSMALRERQVPVLDSGDENGDEKLHTVEVAVTLTNPHAEGTTIEIAVDGVKRLSKNHPTQIGEPVVLHHIGKGSVVTAHVHTWDAHTWDACAYWVTPGNKHYTVGAWELAFTTIEENEQGLVSAKLYQAFIQIVGWGQEVTIEVDHVQTKSFDSVVPNEMLVYPGLQEGVLVKAISASRDTCTYRVGSKETECNLDNTWGLKMGSVVEFGENNDEENTIETEDLIRNYSVEFSLERANDDAKMLEISLNGHQIAAKMKPTEPGKSISVHHVKDGSVFTAVSHESEEACGVYVGVGTQTINCAGWTLNLNIQEEIDGHFENREKFDVSISVHRGSTATTGQWGIMANGTQLVNSGEPLLFPDTWGGWARDTQVVPFVDTVLAQGCTHVVGGNETSCEFQGWNFTILSELNMNEWWDGNNWDWDGDTDDDDDGDVVPYEIKVTATDATMSPHTTLECISRQDLEFYTVPSGETEKNIKNGTQLFKVKNLKKTATNVTSATFIGQFPAGYPLYEGFYCTVYRDESIMCEADTDGGQWTNVQGFTLEIDLN